MIFWWKKTSFSITPELVTIVCLFCPAASGTNCTGRGPEQLKSQGQKGFIHGNHSTSIDFTDYCMSLLTMFISTYFMTFFVLGAMSRLNIYQDNRDVPKSHKSSQPRNENRFRQAILQQSGQEKLLHHRPSYSLLKGGEERVQILYLSSVKPIKVSIYGKDNHPKYLWYSPRYTW